MKKGITHGDNHRTLRDMISFIHVLGVSCVGHSKRTDRNPPPCLHDDCTDVRQVFEIFILWQASCADDAIEFFLRLLLDPWK